MSKAVLNRTLQTISSASLAVLILGFGDFAPMGQSLPDGFPLRHWCIVGSAILLLAASAGLWIKAGAIPSIVVIAAYLVAWGMLNAPLIVSDPLSVGAWYAPCEALTAIGGLLVVCTQLRGNKPGAPVSWLRVAQVLVGLTCIFYGWSHFLYADYTASMVPKWIPWHIEVAYATGACHIAAGVAIASGIVARLAAVLEALMMSLFGLLVWVPSFMMLPRPPWATLPENQWSELAVNIVLAGALWILANALPRSTRTV